MIQFIYQNQEIKNLLNFYIKKDKEWFIPIYKNRSLVRELDITIPKDFVEIGFYMSINDPHSINYFIGERWIIGNIPREYIDYHFDYYNEVYK